MYQPIILPHFKKQLKRHIKKYRHLKEAVISVLEHFDKRQHTHIGLHMYKVRVHTADLKKDKSNSFRMLVFLMERDRYLIPVCVYFKGDREDISKKELGEHIEAIVVELRMENLVQ